jgi:hypothetical protein
MIVYFPICNGLLCRFSNIPLVHDQLGRFLSRWLRYWFYLLPLFLNENFQSMLL